MDEEDVADADGARRIQTTDSFAGLGSTAERRPNNDSFMDILRTTGETMGIKLLKKMGWREGQGVGPKVKRKARLDEEREQGGEPAQQTHLFAPENSTMIAFVRKNDRKGLGFEGEGRLSKANPTAAESTFADANLDDETEEAGFGPLTNGNKAKKKRPQRKGGFGVGILNDNGSDDEDPYEMGPQISYNRIIGGEKKKKKKPEASKSAANPLLGSKPVFISKKAAAIKGDSTFRRCHDGRLPLDGFILSSISDPLSSILSQDGKYLPPAIPQDWKSSKAPDITISGSVKNPYQSPANIAAASKLSPKSRAALLGETPLPGKSVFDYLTPTARTRIASATNNPNLPPALGEGQTERSASSHTKTLHSLVPPLAREIAATALGRGTAGWMPYAEDPEKRARYRIFLEVRAGLRPEGTLPNRALGATNDEWVKEMNEFAHAAQIFKPMTGVMATRFTSSSAPKPASDNVKLEGEPQLLTQISTKAKTPAEEAAAVGMYGPLTRSMENFYPTRLLCKRFNIKPPAHVQVDPGEGPPGFDTGQNERGGGSNAASQTHSTALPQKRLELVGKRDMDELRMNSGLGMRSLEQDVGIKEEGEGGGNEGGAKRRDEAVLVDPERNEALEKERPGEAVFRAIFGSDSEDE